MKLLKQIDFLYNQYVCTAAKIAYRKVFKRKYKFRGIRGGGYFTAEQGNDIIANAIRTGKPCMIARYGSIELKTATDTIAVDLGIRKSVRGTTIAPLCNNAGFFPNDESLAEKFGKLMIESSADMDILAVWYSTMEPYMIKHYAPRATLVNPYSLEPYYYKNPWSYELKGKKVLVIHPFTETIQKQYERKEKLFVDKMVLPEFELITLKAVQSIGGQSDRFMTWFDALSWMEERIDEIDFDVALIGCGAYGFNLASYVKQKGKIGIQIGGALQLLFGIKGHRWTDHPGAYPVLNKMFNDYWVFPPKEDIPPAAKSVENACYW